MRQFTLDSGFFTVTDIQKATGIPRSTAQDWVNRLLQEGCVLLKDGETGRSAARFAAISAMPSSTCRRIFTTVDGDSVGIYHDCMSGACAAFCGYHHALAGGVMVMSSGTGHSSGNLHGSATSDIPVGSHRCQRSVFTGLNREDDTIVQHIRCIGGPAYSLSDMMARAEGVVRVESRHAVAYRGRESLEPGADACNDRYRRYRFKGGRGNVCPCPGPPQSRQQA